MSHVVATILQTFYKDKSLTLRQFNLEVFHQIILILSEKLRMKTKRKDFAKAKKWLITPNHVVNNPMSQGYPQLSRTWI